MNIKKQLPKIGEEIDGHVEFDANFPIKFGIRPDYNFFKSKEDHGAMACLEVLVGLRGIDLIYDIAKRKDSEILEKVDLHDASVLDKAFFKKNGFKNSESLGEHLNTIVFHENLKKLARDELSSNCRNLLSLFREIQVFFETGVTKGEIIATELADTVVYNGLSFLNWMNKNSFPPPEELQFRKNNQGQLEYVPTESKESKQLGLRAERTYLNIIGALLECITGQFKDEVFTSERQLREFIDEKFDDLDGVRSRTLTDKFSQAKKALRGEF